MSKNADGPTTRHLFASTSRCWINFRVIPGMNHSQFQEGLQILEYTVWQGRQGRYMQIPATGAGHKRGCDTDMLDVPVIS